MEILDGGDLGARWLGRGLIRYAGSAVVNSAFRVLPRVDSYDESNAVLAVARSSAAVKFGRMR
jgi:hypothetical protein